MAPDSFLASSQPLPLGNPVQGEQRSTETLAHEDAFGLLPISCNSNGMQPRHLPLRSIHSIVFSERSRQTLRAFCDLTPAELED
ncbi:MAG: hypothetical protein P8M78_13215 [Myxococcota bacterium]|nr:hypothetical protein [Myxococcota bacterium]